jgi:protein-L-isoaspartate(D-aspartate) O-methyltransferase
MPVRLSRSFLFLLLLLLGCEVAAADDFYAERQKMVQEQVIMRGITDENVIAAMRMVPRHLFVPMMLRLAAYGDRPLPIGHYQTISQPYMVALMSEKLALKPGDRVLEVGTGSGYEAAVLAQMGMQVYTIEVVDSLGKEAEVLLHNLGYKNVKVKIGDGFGGWPEHAPFDAVIVTCAPEKVPPPLIEQTREGGRIVIPVGKPGDQKLWVMERKEGKLEKRAILPVRFVPMTGKAEKAEEER